MPIYQIVLFSAAITVVFTQGEIFKFLRRGPWLWRELVKCALCSGVWIGSATYLFFFGYPHVGDELLIWVDNVFRALGAGCSSGCLAVLFVALWDKLDAKAASPVEIRNATMTVLNPSISSPKIKIIPEGFMPDEAPTDPVTSESRLTKKIPVDELRVEASRRSEPGERS